MQNVPRRLFDHRIPLLQAHIDEHAVAQDAGVVDDDTQISKGIRRTLDRTFRPFPFGDVVAIRNCFPTRPADVVHHFTGGTARRTPAIQLGAKIINDDLCSLACELQGMSPPQATPGATTSALSRRVLARWPDSLTRSYGSS